MQSSYRPIAADIYLYVTWSGHMTAAILVFHTGACLRGIVLDRLSAPFCERLIHSPAFSEITVAMLNGS